MTATKEHGRLVVLALLAIALAYPVVRRLMPDTRTPAPSSLQQAIDSSSRAFSAGRYQDAIAYGKAALQADPNSADAYNNIAAAYGGMKNWDVAIQNVRQALRIRPDYQLAKNNLAWYLQEKAAINPPANAPRTADDYLQLSAQLHRAGKYKECIDAARQALKLDPHSAAAYNNIAAAYSDMKMWDDAIAAAQHAVLLDPGFTLAKNNLAWAMDRKSKSK